MEVEIIPAVIPKNFSDLREKAALVCGVAHTMQVDIVDGNFVPSIGWPFQKGDEGEFGKILQRELSLPYASEIEYEADLMVMNPEEDMRNWVRAGFRRFVIHLESTKKAEEIVDEWSHAVEVGIAWNINTQDEKAYPLIKKAKFVQLMGIKEIGYQGQPFEEAVIHKIVALRRFFPDVIISVDGGVNFETAERLVAAGANRLVVGSALWGCDNIKLGIKRLEEITQGN